MNSDPRPARAVAIAALAAGAYVTGAAVARGQSGRTIQDGVFSAEQVARGRASFVWECRECHEMEEFTGAGAYLEGMDGEPLWDVFEFIWNEMPEDRPAWLEPEEYADILAYILSVYGAPTGETPSCPPSGRRSGESELDGRNYRVVEGAWRD